MRDFASRGHFEPLCDPLVGFASSHLTSSLRKKLKKNPLFLFSRLKGDSHHIAGICALFRRKGHRESASFEGHIAVHLDQIAESFDYPVYQFLADLAVGHLPSTESH